MHIQINYHGKVLHVHIREKKEDPINTIYECDIEGVGRMEIAQNDFGDWKDVNGDQHALAHLIAMEMDRVEKLITTSESFALVINYAGKEYDLMVTPIPTEVGTYYRVVHGGKFLSYIFHPAPGEHQWHAGHGYEGDQKLAAVIGIAIENR